MKIILEVKKMINLRNAAQKALTLSEIVENKEKISTEEIIEKYPDGITINNLDIVDIRKQTNYVYTFVEEPDCFAYAGTVLKKVFDQLLQAEKGDLKQLRADLKAQKGLRVKLSTSTTLDDMEVTVVELI